LKHYRPHIFVAFALAVVLLSGWHGTLRNALTDLRFAWEQRQASGKVVVVAIDAPSIDKIGVWPWPRQLHAELLRRLESAGVQDIVFDVDFSTPSDAASDRAFVEALERAGGYVVLPSFQQPGTAADRAAVHVNRPLQQFVDHSWSAVVNVAVEPDGLVRRYPFGDKLGGEFVPSMGAVLAGQYATKSKPFLIDFSIRTDTIPGVSYVEVLRGDEATLNKLRDKKVIIGGTALELGDRFSIPNGNVISGPLLQALAAESILQGRTLRWTSDITTAVGLCIIALIMMASWRRLSAGRRVAVLFGLAASAEFIASLVQVKLPFVLDTSLFHTAIVVYMTAIALDEIDLRGLLSRIAESRFQRIAMSLGDGLICTDQDHRITLWNPGAVAIFGYAAAEMIGQPFETICAGNAEGVLRSFSNPDTATAHPRLQQPGGAVVEFDGRRKSGEVFPAEACFSGWQGADGLQYGAILRDISARKREAERIRYLAEYDALTGLANRSTLHEALVTMIAAAERQGNEVALLVVGLDAFQQINNMLGHASGDRVLRAVSTRLKAEIAGAGIVARLSGDEFAIATPCNDRVETIKQLCERLALTFTTPLMAGTRLHRLRVTIGAAAYPAGGQTADELLANSHLAFCRAKAIRRCSYVIFENTIRQELEARLTLEAELARAAERNEFELYYQPQVRLTDGSPTGAEALIRWRHPVRGLVSPGEFMPVVNTSSISDRVAAWVLETACRQARVWEEAGHSIRVSVNLSPSQFQSGDLAISVAHILETTGLTPSLLELEVTEDILLLDEQRVLDIFEGIRELGVRIVFDDFGTGYASLSYLKKFHLDGLKVDRTFVKELLTDTGDAAIVGSTISLSRQLGMSVIAEGIENRATADLLLSMGCEEGQGYFFGRPMPAQALESQFLAAPESAAEVSGAGKAA
jgi:diguanylate cyclase (GGDEF)-like protein/PAS domain S-box-containing protein